MTLDEFEDPILLDKIINLKVEKHKHKERLSIIAPTWLVSDKLNLTDFLDEFSDIRNLQENLRDFACIPSASLRPYFKDPSILEKRAVTFRESPINNLLQLAPWFVPLPGIRYFFTSDLSVSRDSTGIALVHREIFPGNKLKYFVDFSLQMKVSHAEKMDYEAVRNLIRTLKKKGFKIAMVGFDQFQSHDSATIMENEGFPVEIVKYSDSLAGCGLLFDLIYADDIVYGLCDDIFIGEAGELQVINERRIDHLSSTGKFNSKDVWDAVVNAVVLASHQKSSFSREYLKAK